jgi:hypothetical protein
MREPKAPMTFDGEIARQLQEAAASGELTAAESWGKPFPEDPGWHGTPAALRMPMKILKDAGAAPPEVEMMRERATLRSLLAETAGAAERQALQRRLADLELKIACRLEALGRESSL